MQTRPLRTVYNTSGRVTLVYMKNTITLSILILAGLGLPTACGKQQQKTNATVSPVAAPVAQTQHAIAKHGYELAKTWSEQTANDNISFSRSAYELLDFGNKYGSTQVRLEILEYEACVNSAQASKVGDDLLGPQTRAKYKCDSRIDAIEAESARTEAEMKK